MYVYGKNELSASSNMKHQVKNRIHMVIDN